jgi:UDP-N-acetylmuramate dehydrogenase
MEAQPALLKSIVEKCLKESPCDPAARYGEPLSKHSTFKVGGNADCYLRPRGEGFPDFAAALFKAAHCEGVRVFVLGGGSNTVFSDSGFRGIVLDTGGWSGTAADGGLLHVRCGTPANAASKAALAAGLSGLEFLAGMPGSIGGAVRMNAGCFGSEVSAVLQETEGLDPGGGNPQRFCLAADISKFGYRKSPFQNRQVLLLNAVFRLAPGDADSIAAKMQANRNDRKEKGHYRFPSAGSVFKNNPGFAMPTGKIIDSLGLCGTRIGGAQVAPWHGNIIINTGGATAADIKTLCEEIAEKVKAEKGFELEPEILFVS